MAAVLGIHSNFCQLTGPNLQKRFERYSDMYKRALIKKKSTGAGLTVEELQSGDSLDAQLEKICPHFDRMDWLYGERHNALPPCELNSGVGGGSGLTINIGDSQPEPVVVAAPEAVAPEAATSPLEASATCGDSGI
ncbi:unnamed protein product [Calypogeia fissa]